MPRSHGHSWASSAAWLRHVRHICVLALSARLERVQSVLRDATPIAHCIVVICVGDADLMSLCYRRDVCSRISSSNAGRRRARGAQPDSGSGRGSARAAWLRART